MFSALLRRMPRRVLDGITYAWEDITWRNGLAACRAAVCAIILNKSNIFGLSNHRLVHCAIHESICVTAVSLVHLKLSLLQGASSNLSGYLEAHRECRMPVNIAEGRKTVYCKKQVHISRDVRRCMSIGDADRRHALLVTILNEQQRRHARTVAPLASRPPSNFVTPTD